MKKILVVEDEAAIADLICIALNTNGFETEYALDGEKGADLIEKNQYDLVLLDIMLPKHNGYELLEYAKELNTPVIFITAKGQMKDRVKGLNMGADDYIVKPFEIEEMLARVNSVIRRTGKAVEIKGLLLDFNRRVIIKDNKEIKLTPKEYELFLYLYENEGKVITREKLFQRVWFDELDFETRTLDLHIQRIRKKLNFKSELKTVHKIGYVFEVGK